MLSLIQPCVPARAVFRLQPCVPARAVLRLQPCVSARAVLRLQPCVPARAVLRLQPCKDECHQALTTGPNVQGGNPSDIGRHRLYYLPL